MAVATGVLRRLEAARVLVCGRLRPESLGGTGEEWCDAEVLRTLRRRSLAALRAEVEPVAPEALGVFLPRWHGIGTLRGTDGLLRVVEQLSGAAVPASALETLVLPSRVTDYSPALLDELTTTGEVLWCGHSSLPGGKDGLVSLHLADAAPLTLPDVTPLEEDGPLDTDLHRSVVDLLTGSGGFFLPRIAELAEASQAATLEVLWDLVWAGWVTNDGLGALRSRLGPGGGAHRAPRAPVRARPLARGRFASLGAGSMAAARGESDLRGGSGRWSALPLREPDPTRRTHALTRVLLDRHGVLTRGAAPSEGVTNYFRGVYRVLSELETTGTVRRGYFVEHLGGSQFALPGAVDQLRTDAQDREHAAESAGRRELSALLLAATDPANPYGAALPWPEPRVPHEPGGGAPVGLGVRSGSAPGGRPEVRTAASATMGASTAVALAPGTGPARSTPRATHRPGRKVGSVVVLAGGDLVLYVERGGRSLLSFGDDSEISARRLALACAELARASRAGLLGKMVIGRIDGIDALAGAGSTASRAFGVTAALMEAGFRPTPRGLRA